MECSQYAECVNTEGSYECRCKAGYRGDGSEVHWLVKQSAMPNTVFKTRQYQVRKGSERKQVKKRQKIFLL